MTDDAPLGLDEVRGHAERVLEQVERAVVGKREVLELVLIGLLADGHVLLEDFPGLAKTLLARSFAQAMTLQFARIQFTPDLMPSDITGSTIFNQRTGDFETRPGPIFANLVLGDEINRSPPKTQAALLEAMQERQVTIEGTTARLPRPFLVLATQNPIEYEGTYPLPEAQLDRFLLRTAVGYPERGDEARMLQERRARRQDEVALDAVLDGPQLVACQTAVEGVTVADEVVGYVVDLVRATRQSARVQVGASPRGSLALLKLSRARAALRGRDFVVPDDIQALAAPALAHRLTLRPELWVQRIRAEDVVQECCAQVPVPPTLPPEMLLPAQGGFDPTASV
ncbi:MAG TPA: MoxR family ATPase [Candidatus Micrarchaeia archaeon]|nr:MoxR family ATPase [Candidatus Micrarchaeia archaeon]